MYQLAIYNMTFALISFVMLSQYDERRYCEDDFQTLFAPCCKQCGQ